MSNSLTPTRPGLAWAYGVTTVPERRTTYLPATLASLARAGFDRPWLFIDGAAGDTGESYRAQFPNDGVTCRWPALGVVGNWILALWELWVRSPAAQRYVIFQDDVLCVNNLRAYLDRSPWPGKGYLNLYTFVNNERVILGKPRGHWYESGLISDGHNNPDLLQTGRGALGLVFDKEAMIALLGSHDLATKPNDPTHGRCKIDGCVVTALNKAGFREYVHAPSLLQHQGVLSSMRKERLPYPKLPLPPAKTFPGELFDALTLLPKGSVSRPLGVR